MEPALDSLETDVPIILRRLLDKIVGAETDVFIIETERYRDHDGISIRVKPTKPGCASIAVFVENGDPTLYVTLGFNTIFEVPLRGGRYTDLEGINEFTAIVEAAVLGKFSETVWRKDSRVVKSVGRLTVLETKGERETGMTHVEFLQNPLKEAKKSTYHYLPYRPL